MFSQPKQEVQQPRFREEETSSIDTYEEELGEDHEMPKMRPSDRFRQTLEAREERPMLDPATRQGWQMCSAGSKQLKGIALKVMKEHPELLEDNFTKPKVT